MLKLISLNMEGQKHVERIKPFLTTESADVICLMEAPEHFQEFLQSAGYQAHFAPMLWREDQGERFREGLIFSSTLPCTLDTSYYYGSAEQIVPHVHRQADTISHPVCIATIKTEDGPYIITTTHVMVTSNGQTDEHQQAGMQALFEILSRLPPHIICGDFNMPRGVNDLYEEVTRYYIDRIPNTYMSSLDRGLHRLGSATDLDEPIFDTYMVDYIFTQAPYEANDVRLQFGVSDHAAVIGTIHTTKPPPAEAGGFWVLQYHGLKPTRQSGGVF